MIRKTPPFRADQVGSLLRTEVLRAARARRARREIDDAELEAVEDGEILKIIRRQEEIGLDAVTDGEFRRSWWHYDFLAGIEGIDLVQGGPALGFVGVAPKAEGPVITGPLRFNGHPMIEHFRFLQANTARIAKMTIPSPSVLHFRIGSKAIAAFYPDRETFFAELGALYKKIIRAFYDANCRYLQLDDTVWAFLCSPVERARAAERGEPVDELPRLYREMINAALSERPTDMTVTMHVCRGNFRSTWISEGGYGPVADTLLGGLDIDGYFLEYDSERAGGFAPLAALPKGNKVVVLGLITSKHGELENRDDIKRRIEEATKYMPIDQLALSPQCGFGSTEEGNRLTESEQWRKLREVVEIARDVWG